MKPTTIILLVAAGIFTIKFGYKIIKQAFKNPFELVLIALGIVLFCNTTVLDALFSGNQTLKKNGYSQSSEGMKEMLTDIYDDREVYAEAYLEVAEKYKEKVAERLSTSPYGLNLVDAEGYRIDSEGNRVSSRPLTEEEKAMLIEEYNKENGTDYQYYTNKFSGILKELSE